MIRSFHVKDDELFSRFVRDDENPDYIIATEKCLYVLEDCLRLRDYFRRRKDSIFIFLSYECVEPDMNLFDYAFTWDTDFVYGDRIAHNVSSIYENQGFHKNDLTLEAARKILASNPSFCNFIYSHPCEPRDSCFRLLSQYKRVDSSGFHLNNTGKKATRWYPNWYALSIEMKTGYKFSIAMENANRRGYHTEKILSSLRAHTVPIYWGDPAVADYVNPKAFINCNDYSSFDEVIERVKEIDNNDELWLDMVTQPWHTEEQISRVMHMLDENDAFLRNIFTQDIKSARRRSIGYYPDCCRNGFTGFLGTMPRFYVRAASRLTAKVKKLIPAGLKPTLRKFLQVFHKN